MKKFLSLILILALLASVCPAAFAEMVTLREVMMPHYFVTADNEADAPVYFVGDADVPYVTLRAWAEIMEVLFGGEDKQFAMDYSIEGDVGILTREDGYTARFDTEDDTISFIDYDAFVRPNEERVIIDLLSVDNPAPDGDKGLFRRTDGSYERYGESLVLDLDAYGIHMYSDGEDVYVPLQTLSDFLLANRYVNVFYNGQAIFFAQYEGLLGDDGELSEIGKLAYSVEKGARSQEMADFSYAELCLALDYQYGLKESHGFRSFDLLCKQAGLEEALRSTDPNIADQALWELINFHLDDLHSSFTCVSPLSAQETQDRLNGQKKGRAETAFFVQLDRYTDARVAAYPDGMPHYEEVGNTAYIMFDSFSSTPRDVNYYETAPTDAEEDTIGILLYAYSQIMREGSPIENVVLDLSCNLGGDADTAVFTICAFLGDGYVSATNTMTGAMSVGEYQIDLNLDGRFDEKDRGLTTKNLFCLISPASFSCGNLVPNVFKNSNMVTLLGRTSGGGSCIVQPLSTAYGTVFQTSGCTRLAFTKNGSFYDIDQGAVPDFVLSRPESFYDRAGLTDYINNLK